MRECSGLLLLLFTGRIRYLIFRLGRGAVLVSRILDNRLQSGVGGMDFSSKDWYGSSKVLSAVRGETVSGLIS